MRSFVIPTGMSIAEFVQSSKILREALKEWTELGLHDPLNDTVEDFYYNYIDSDDFENYFKMDPTMNHTLPDSLADLGAEFNDNGQVVMPDGRIIDLWDTESVESGFTDKVYELEDALNQVMVPTKELKTMEDYRYDSFIDEYAINHPYMSFSQRQEYLANKFPEFKHLLMNPTVINKSYIKSDYTGMRNESGRRTRIAMIEEELRARTPSIYQTIQAKQTGNILPASYIHNQAIKIYDAGFNSVAEYEYQHGIGSATLFQFQDNAVPLSENLILHNNNGIYHFEGGTNMIQPNPIAGATKPAPPATGFNQPTSLAAGTFSNSKINDVNNLLDNIKKAQNEVEVKAPAKLPPLPAQAVGYKPVAIDPNATTEKVVQNTPPVETTPSVQSNGISQVIPTPTPIQITNEEIDAVKEETIKNGMSVHERAKLVEKELQEELKHEEEQRRKGLQPTQVYNIPTMHIPNRDTDPLIERYRNSQLVEDSLTKLNSLDNPRLAAARITFSEFEEILGYAVISGIFPETKFDSLMKFLNLIGVGDRFTNTVEILANETIPEEYQFTNMRLVNMKKLINPSVESQIESDTEFSRRAKTVSDKKPLFGSITKTHIMDLLDYINRNGLFVYFNDKNIQYAYSELAKYAQDHIYSDRVAHSWRTLITFICEDLGNDDQLLVEAFSLTYGKDPKKKIKKEIQEDIIMNNKEIINTTMAATMPSNPMAGRVTVQPQPVVQPAGNGTMQPVAPAQPTGTQPTNTVPQMATGTPAIQPPVQTVQPQTTTQPPIAPQTGVQPAAQNQYTQPVVQQYVQPTNQNQYVQPNQPVVQGGNMYTQTQYIQPGVAQQPVQYVNVPTQPIYNQAGTQPVVQQYAQPQVQTVNAYQPQPMTTPYMQPQNPYAPKPMVQPVAQPGYNPYMPQNMMTGYQAPNPYATQQAVNPYAPKGFAPMPAYQQPMNPYAPKMAMPYTQPQVNPYMQTPNSYVAQPAYTAQPNAYNPYMPQNPYAPKMAMPYTQPQVNPYMSQQPMNPYAPQSTYNPYMQPGYGMQPQVQPTYAQPGYTQPAYGQPGYNPYMAPTTPYAPNPYQAPNPYMSGAYNPYMSQPGAMGYQQPNAYNPYMTTPYQQPMMAGGYGYGAYGRNFY